MMIKRKRFFRRRARVFGVAGNVLHGGGGKVVAVGLNLLNGMFHQRTIDLICGEVLL